MSFLSSGWAGARERRSRRSGGLTVIPLAGRAGHRTFIPAGERTCLHSSDHKQRLRPEWTNTFKGFSTLE